MSDFDIIAPRWHDKVVLIADHKLTEHNTVRIRHKDYPFVYYLSGRYAKKFPLEDMKTKAGGIIQVRAIPILDIQREEL